MAYKKGQSGNPAGRPPGVPNRSTASVKAALMEAFDGLGGVPALIKWGMKEKNRGEFYRLYARLIPIDVNHSGAIDFGTELAEARKRVAEQQQATLQ